MGLDIVAKLAARGAASVWLAKERGTRDTLARSTTYKPDRYSQVSLEDIRRGLELVRRDTWVRVGDQVYRQISGLAMGNMLSPVLARMRIDVANDRLYRAPKQFHPALPPLLALGPRVSSWLASVYHVDDCAVWSWRLCTRCIFDTLREAWPADVGITLEAEGDAF